MKTNATHETGGIALQARVLGLGIATAISLTVGAAPTIAHAEATGTDAVVASLPGDEAVQPVSTEDQAAAAETATADQAFAAGAPTGGQAATDVVADALAQKSDAQVTSEEDAAPAQPPQDDAVDATTGKHMSDAPVPQHMAEPAAPKHLRGAETSATTPATAGAPASDPTAAPEATADPTDAPEAAIPEVATQAAVVQPQAQTSANAESAMADKMNVYRLYNSGTDEHLYTSDFAEAKAIARDQGWQYEGVGFTASRTTGTAVYRLYDPTTGLHLWTTDANERSVLLGKGRNWNDEGVAWYGAGSFRMLRLFNTSSGQHLYTRDTNEAQVLARELGWTHETEAGTWMAGDSSDYVPIQAQWLTSNAWGEGARRYWVQSNGSLAKNRYLDPSETGLDHRVYVGETGAMVDGVYQVDDTHVMVAKTDGSLLTGFGWVQTGEFDNGTPRRYYVENDDRVRAGLFKVGGNQYYGFFSHGYVATSQTIVLSDREYEADAQGVLDDGSSFVSMWARRIDDYMAGFPLAGTGEAFASVALRYGLDPRISPAIASIESTRGKNCFRAYNAWGWTGESFSSWTEAIEAHVRYLATSGFYGFTSGPYGKLLTQEDVDTYSGGYYGASYLQSFMRDIWS